jgi:hypothetical protein
MLRSLLPGDATEIDEPFLVRIRKRPFQFLIILLCLVNITLILINIGLWVIAAYQKLFFAADFTSFYTGFYMVRIGEGVNLYNSALQAKFQQLFMGGMTFEGGVLLFPNPPFIAILFSPLSFLQLDAAFYIWTLMQLGLLVWLLFRIKYLFPHWERYERIVLIITILAFWHLTNSFLLEQFSLFLFLSGAILYLYEEVQADQSWNLVGLHDCKTTDSADSGNDDIEQAILACRCHSSDYWPYFIYCLLDSPWNPTLVGLCSIGPNHRFIFWQIWSGSNH